MSGGRGFTKSMDKIVKESHVRDLRNGNWYWIHKAVIQKYTPKVGAIGIAVYNLLASLADSHQTCFPSQKYIAQCLNYSRATINKTLKRLKENGLIRIEKRDRYHCTYSLLKVRCKRGFTSNSRCKAGETQMSNRGNSDVNQVNTNNNKLTINNNDNIDNKNFLNFDFKGFTPNTREELLALDVAKALNDHKGLPLYLSYCKRYPESLIRKTLGEVKEIPFEKIKKSQGALFNYLIQKYAQDQAHS